MSYGGTNRPERTSRGKYTRVKGTHSDKEGVTDKTPLLSSMEVNSKEDPIVVPTDIDATDAAEETKHTPIEESQVKKSGEAGDATGTPVATKGLTKELTKDSKEIGTEVINDRDNKQTIQQLSAARARSDDTDDDSTIQSITTELGMETIVGTGEECQDQTHTRSSNNSKADTIESRENIGAEKAKSGELETNSDNDSEDAIVLDIVERRLAKADLDEADDSKSYGAGEAADKITELPEHGPDHRSSGGAIPKQFVRKSKSENNMSTDTFDKLDIVRKMSEPHSRNYVPWQLVGPYQKLKQKMCQRLYAETGRSDDMALFFHNGRFYALEAWCSHMGGPLFEGDIEDYNGRCHVMCPWHSYMFDLESGKNEIGLQQKVYTLKYENGNIYVRYHSALSLDLGKRKISEAASGKPYVINFPPKAGKSPAPVRECMERSMERKLSVLETPFIL